MRTIFAATLASIFASLIAAAPIAAPAVAGDRDRYRPLETTDQAQRRLSAEQYEARRKDGHRGPAEIYRDDLERPTLLDPGRPDPGRPDPTGPRGYGSGSDGYGGGSLPATGTAAQTGSPTSLASALRPATTAAR